MTVQDYAEDMNFTVQDVLNKCNELGINIKNKDSVFSDDDIVLLDNTMNLISANDDLTMEENDELDDVVDDVMGDSELQLIEKMDSKTTEKVRRRPQGENTVNLNKDFQRKKKAMYKNKERLTSNDDNNSDDSIVLYKENMSLGELGEKLNISSAEVVTKAMELGQMISTSQSVDYDTAEMIAAEYNKVLKKEETQDISNFEQYEIVDKEEDLVTRPPVITIMGHVDHGKTTLLDYIRHSHVAEGEAGGITQSIGAYQIEYNNHKITFIDTPGHAAFTEMRARGAQITDIVIIIVSAEDGVMPQTKEAIDHAKAAGVPIVVVINKIDKPDAKPEVVMQEMANEGLTPEEWGGDIPYLKISAKTGEGVDKLLDTLLAIAEVRELKANPNRYATGTVIESKLDTKTGGVANILIQNGTLRIGDPLVVGTTHGRVRTMKSSSGKDIVEAGPSTPVSITGLTGNPDAGDKFMAFESEKKAREIAEKRFEDKKSRESVPQRSLNLDDLFASIQDGTKEINVVLKCDVRGSEEAVKNSLEKIDVKGVKCKVIRSGIGTITESDISLAKASNAIIIGFNIVASNQIKENAKQDGIDIRLYTIIYKLVEDMEAAMNGMLDPLYEDKVIGEVTVKQLFKFSKIGIIAGCIVNDGLIKSSAKVRVIRDDIIICDGEIGSLQSGKQSVKEVKKGFECGVTIAGYNDIKVGDKLQIYETVEVKR